MNILIHDNTNLVIEMFNMPQVNSAYFWSWAIDFQVAL